MINELEKCTICPRNCGINRLQGKKGFCGVADKIIASKTFLHHWEEPCISGERGSGTVFFSGCNMKCIFCQNYEISSFCNGKTIEIEELSDIFLGLQKDGAHNINLVTPTHFILHIVKALETAKAKGLYIPVIYNTSGYEKVESLKKLKGLVDVFLPDIKYFSSTLSRKYSSAVDYFTYAAQAIKFMINNWGYPYFDKSGMLIKGVLIRHLILPGCTRDSKKILKWVYDNFGTDAYISLMSQYTPMHLSATCPEINRKLTQKEYDEVVDYFFQIGLENGFVQENSSADEKYKPDFDLKGL